MDTFTVEYNSNNSGGDWWLTDKDWQKLEKAGWFVEWGLLDFCNSRFGPWPGAPKVAPDTHEPDKCPGHRRFESYADAKASGYRWLGSLAKSATIEVQAEDREEAEAKAQSRWVKDLDEKYDGFEEGCSCCGEPHSFWAKSKPTVAA